MPWVEVAFDIDANGIVNVAKDKATGKDNRSASRPPVACPTAISSEWSKRLKITPPRTKSGGNWSKREPGRPAIHATEKTLADFRTRFPKATVSIEQVATGNRDGGRGRRGHHPAPGGIAGRQKSRRGAKAQRRGRRRSGGDADGATRAATAPARRWLTPTRRSTTKPNKTA